MRLPLVCFLLLAPLPATPPEGADWPQFLGPNRNGTTPETELRTRWPKKGPPVLWQRPVGEGYSTPVVADGRLVLFHRVGDQEVVEALDATSGKGLWKFAYATAYEDAYGKGNGPRATPAVAGGRVYTLGPAGVLSCVALKDGKKVWQRALHRTYSVPASFFGVGTSPLVEGGLVLVNVGAPGAGIVAFDSATGKERWRATDDEASYSSPVAATIGGVRHLLFFTRTGLVSLNPANGAVRFRKRWRSRLHASVNAATPLVLDGRYVFLSASYGTGAVLLKVNKDSVEEVWKGNDRLSCHFSTPVAVGPYLFGCDGRQEEGARLRCIEWKTGKVRWTKADFGCGSIIAAGRRLILLSEEGELALAEATPERYKELASATVLRGPCRANLALAGGRLYGRDGAKLVCWDLRK
jgi:outer membrane protein assembly factor BamB